MHVGTVIFNVDAMCGGLLAMANLQSLSLVRLLCNKILDTTLWNKTDNKTDRDKRPRETLVVTMIENTDWKWQLRIDKKKSDEK